MNNSNVDRLLLGAVVAGVAGLVGYQIFKECKKLKQEKSEPRIMNVDSTPIRLPNSSQLGFYVDVREVPTIIELVVSPQQPTDGDIKITITNKQIIAQQYNGITAGKWMLMNQTSADVRPYSQLHVSYDYGEITVTDMNTEGSPVLLNALPVVQKSSRTVGPLYYLLLNGATWVSGTL